MRKFFYLLMIILSTMFIFSGSAAADWFQRGIDVPPQTTEKKKDTKTVAGRDAVYTYYESSLGVSNLKDFYRKRLPRQGWKERDFQSQIKSQLPDNSIDKRYDVFLDNNLLFDKGGKELIISFVPSGMRTGGKTMFVVAETTVKEDTYDQYIPKSTLAPKKNIAPVYPGAYMVQLDEDEDSMRGAYFTKDDADKVIAFFKSEMGKYDWSLVSEKPFSKMDTGAAESYGLKALFLAELNFTNSAADTCRIEVSKSEFKEEQITQDLKITNIRVVYDKKK